MRHKRLYRLAKQAAEEIEEFALKYAQSKTRKNDMLHNLRYNIAVQLVAKYFIWLKENDPRKWPVDWYLDGYLQNLETLIEDEQLPEDEREGYTFHLLDQYKPGLRLIK